jgi:hypothetical protein
MAASKISSASDAPTPLLQAGPALNEYHLGE